MLKNTDMHSINPNLTASNKNNLSKKSAMSFLTDFAKNHQAVDKSQIKNSFSAVIQDMLAGKSLPHPHESDIGNIVDFIFQCVKRSIILSNISIDVKGAINIIYESGNKLNKITGITFENNWIHYIVQVNNIYQYSDKKIYDPSKLNDLYANMA